jgi:hypothetical protein
MQLVTFFFLDEEEDTAETAVRKAIGEGFYKGPLTALLGVDLSSRIGLSGLILQANRFNHDASLEEDVFHYARRSGMEHHLVLQPRLQRHHEW